MTLDDASSELLITGDACGGAPLTDAGKTLRSWAELGELEVDLCGLAGPLQVAGVALPRSGELTIHPPAFVGASPAAVFVGDCHSPRLLGCLGADPLVVPDLASGTRLWVATASAAPPEGADRKPSPELRTDLVPVLTPGDACHPTIPGRCTRGTTCLDASGAEPGPSVVGRCVAHEGASCVFPRSIVLGMQPSRLHFPAATATVPGDHHHSACGGIGSPEWVVQLEFSGDLQEWVASAAGAGARLRMSSDIPGVTLGLRSPGCAWDESAACRPGVEGVLSELELEAEPISSSGAGAVVFVELPLSLPSSSGSLELSVR